MEGVRVGEGVRVEEESTLAHKAGSTSMGNSGGSKKPVRDAGRRGAAAPMGGPEELGTGTIERPPYGGAGGTGN